MQPCCGAAFAGAAAGAAVFWGGGGGGGGNVLTTGAGAATTVARGIATVSVCSPFCSVAALRSTDRRIQPPWPSPVRRLAVSMNTATPSFPLATVPTSVKFGCCGAAGGGGGGGRGAATGALAITGAGAPRAGLNRGRA